MGLYSTASLLAAFVRRQFFTTPPEPTTSFEGKVVIVTGANTGLGKEACRWVVRLKAARVILACRDTEKGKEAAKDIQLTTSCSDDVLQVWHLDLSSYASVMAFCDKATTDLPRLDAFIANAGRGTGIFKMTEDNEETITTNVVSLALQAMLLVPKLHETGLKFNTHTNLTICTSEMFEFAEFKERSSPPGQLFATLNNEKTANMPDRYNVSKLLEVFIVKQLATLMPLNSKKVVVNCVCPAFCRTELARDVDGNVFMSLFFTIARTAEVGSRALVHGASSGPDSHGQYLPDCKVTPAQGLAAGKEGAELQERVWKELVVKLEGIRPGISSTT